MNILILFLFSVPSSRSKIFAIHDVFVLFWFHTKLIVYPNCIIYCTVFFFYMIFGMCSQKVVVSESSLIVLLRKSTTKKH